MKHIDTQWVEQLFHTIDTLDIDALLFHYTPGASFRFANHDPWHGHAEIRAGLEQFYSTIQAMRHEEQGVWVAPDGQSAAFEAHAHYTLPGGNEVVIPAISVLRMQNGLISDFRFVMDAAPLSQ